MFLTTDDGNLGENVTEVLEEGWRTWTGFGMALAIAVGIAIGVAIVVAIILSLVGRRMPWALDLHARLAWPFRTTLLIIAAIVACIALPGDDLRRGVQHTLAIALIASAAWLLAQVFLFFVDSGTKRYKLTESDSFSARKARTQLQIIRRLVVAVIVIFALGAILMTFDEVRAVGASVLASAGVASIVAGLAAQSILGNLFAGVQLAFSEAIRVGDVVVVQGEWGKIREITLSYVVLEVWDQRTLVLPCTYFTTTPFENWTKLGKALLGTVYFDLDWRDARGARSRARRDRPVGRRRQRRGRHRRGRRAPAGARDGQRRRLRQDVVAALPRAREARCVGAARESRGSPASAGADGRAARADRRLRGGAQCA